MDGVGWEGNGGTVGNVSAFQSVLVGRGGSITRCLCSYNLGKGNDFIMLFQVPGGGKVYPGGRVIWLIGKQVEFTKRGEVQLPAHKPNLATCLSHFILLSQIYNAYCC